MPKPYRNPFAVSFFLQALLIQLSIAAPLSTGFVLPLLPIQTTYIYGYTNSLVIAEVTNAKVEQVAYSSFESADLGYWTYAGGSSGSATDPGRTGNNYYTLSSRTIQRMGLLKGKYVVSYWANGAATLAGTNYTAVNQKSGPTINGWTYYETVFNLSVDNSSITLSGSIKIDELRLFPFDAYMTTYTYDPLVGKTSETNANNQSSFFEYDEYNRLLNVRDQNGNIIKNLIYHIKGQ